MPNQNVVELIINGVDKTITAVKSAEGNITHLKDVTNKTGLNISSMGDLLGKAFAGFSVAGAIGGLAYFMKHIIDTADELNKMSQRVGVSVESLSTLRYAADLSDVELEGLDSSLDKLNKSIYAAGEGSKETADAFKSLGVKVTDSNGYLKNTETVLFDVATKFSKMKDGTEKSALAMKVFGKSGADLIPLLNQGAVGITELQTQARALGIEISTNTAVEAEKFNDQLLTLQYRAEGIATKALPGVLEELNGFVWALNNLSVKNLWTILWGGEPEEYTKEKELLEKQVAERRKLEEKRREIDKQKAVDKAEEEAKQRESERNEMAFLSWKKNTLNDILFNGLDPQTKKLYEMAVAVEDLQKKYAGIPSEQRKISAYFDEWIMDTKDLDQVHLVMLMDRVDKLSKEFGVIPGQLVLAQKEMAILAKMAGVDIKPLDIAHGLSSNLGLPTELKPINIDKIKKAYEEVREKGLEVTTGQLVDWLLMEGVVSNVFGNMASASNMFYQALGEKQSVAFEMYKAFSVAETLATTYQSAVKAYDAMVGIPIVGPALAVAAAASAVAFGIAKVEMIRNLRPGNSGSSGGGASASSAPSYSGGMQAYANQVTNNNNSATKNITINIHSVGGFGSSADKHVREELAPAINRALKDGVINFSFAD